MNVNELDKRAAKIKQLIQTNKQLLDFIRAKYPEDFVEGGPGFTCMYHQRISELIADLEQSP